MATYYQGYRRVLRGQDSNDYVHPYKGEGTYSNWSIFNENNLLSGFPDNHVEPGEGKFPHNVWLSRRFRGLDTKSPMDNPGDGARLSYHRLHMMEFKGLPSAEVLADAGHAPRPWAFTYSRTTNNHFFYGVPSANPLLDAGHGLRDQDDPGTANTFGRINFFINKGVNPGPLDDPGQAPPDPDETGVYGFERVQEWFGVPSAKAL